MNSRSRNRCNKWNSGKTHTVETRHKRTMKNAVSNGCQSCGLCHVSQLSNVLPHPFIRHLPASASSLHLSCTSQPDHSLCDWRVVCLSRWSAAHEYYRGLYFHYFLTLELLLSQTQSVLARKAQRRLYLSWKRRFFSVCRKMLYTSYLSVVEREVLSAVICWSSSVKVSDLKLPNKLIKKALCWGLFWSFCSWLCKECCIVCKNNEQHCTSSRRGSNQLTVRDFSLLPIAIIFYNNSDCNNTLFLFFENWETGCNFSCRVLKEAELYYKECETLTDIRSRSNYICVINKSNTCLSFSGVSGVSVRKIKSICTFIWSVPVLRCVH